VRVVIRLTLTAPGCGMGEILANEVADKVLAMPRVAEVTVDMVFDPPWDRSRMSEAALLTLGCDPPAPKNLPLRQDDMSLNILLLEDVHASATPILSDLPAAEIVRLKHAPGAEELQRLLADVQVLGLRSRSLL
jgi:metal-sulfur cluster biosynthetic enzyme